MDIAFTFPGQGSQSTGMGADIAQAFPEARAVFKEVDEALDEKLSTIIWEGTQETLTLTQNAQPALMAVSVAVIRVLESQLGEKLWSQVKFVAGHSLGEYSALAAAGALSVSDCARLLRTRGLAMQNAVPVGEGAMAAVLGIDLPEALKIAEEAAGDGVCQAANDNAPGQVVLSGSKSAIDRAIEIAPDHGARRAVPLPVSAPFHCSLMKPAQDVMAEALGKAEIKAPRVPLVANVLASDIQNPEDIRAKLIEQVTGMVRWRESISFMADAGVGTVYEIGAGKVLTGLARRIERNLDAVPIGTADDIGKAVEAFNA